MKRGHLEVFSWKMGTTLIYYGVKKTSMDCKALAMLFVAFPLVSSVRKAYHSSHTKIHWSGSGPTKDTSIQIYRWAKQ